MINIEKLKIVLSRKNYYYFNAIMTSEPYADKYDPTLYYSLSGSLKSCSIIVLLIMIIYWGLLFASCILPIIICNSIYDSSYNQVCSPIRNSMIIICNLLMLGFTIPSIILGIVVKGNKKSDWFEATFIFKCVSIIVIMGAFIICLKIESVTSHFSYGILMILLLTTMVLHMIKELLMMAFQLDYKRNN